MRKLIAYALAVQLLLLVALCGYKLLPQLSNQSPLRCVPESAATITVTANGGYAAVASAVNESMAQFGQQYVSGDAAGEPVYQIYYSLLRSDSKLTIIEARVVRGVFDMRELQHPTGAVIEDYYVRDLAVEHRRQLWVNTTEPQMAKPLWVDPDEWLINGRIIEPHE